MDTVQIGVSIVTTETVDQTQVGDVTQEAPKPTIEQLQASLSEKQSTFNEASSAFEAVRFDRKADFESLKAAQGKMEALSREVAKLERQVKDYESDRRMSQLVGLSESVQEAGRAIMVANLDKLKELEVKGYTVTVSDFDSENGISVTARPGGISTSKTSSGGTGKRRSKTTYDGKSARDFITERGPEKWDGTRIAKILDDPNNLNHYARTLAK